MSNAIRWAWLGARSYVALAVFRAVFRFVKPGTAGMRVSATMFPFVPLKLFRCAQQSIVKIQPVPLQAQCLAFT
jgi:hypothetical protein